jgi:hypothetical protein
VAGELRQRLGLLLDPDRCATDRGRDRAFLYDALIRDILMARGENPDPGVRERGRTVVDEG